MIIYLMVTRELCRVYTSNWWLLLSGSILSSISFSASGGSGYLNSVLWIIREKRLWVSWVLLPHVELALCCFQTKYCENGKLMLCWYFLPSLYYILESSWFPVFLDHCIFLFCPELIIIICSSIGPDEATLFISKSERFYILIDMVILVYAFVKLIKMHVKSVWFNCMWIFFNRMIFKSWHGKYGFKLLHAKTTTTNPGYTCNQLFSVRERGELWFLRISGNIFGCHN